VQNRTSTPRVVIPGRKRSRVIESEKAVRAGNAAEASGIDESIGGIVVVHANDRLQRHANWIADTGKVMNNNAIKSRHLSRAITRRCLGKRRGMSTTISLNPIFRLQTKAMIRTFFIERLE
jgi:hypothetical protein